MRHFIGAVILMLALAPTAGISQDKKKFKILYITQSKGFKHGSVDRKKGDLAPSEISMTDIGATSGLFEVECTQDASILTPDKLKQLDAVMFYTTGGKAPEMKDFGTLEAWIKSKNAPVTVEEYAEFEQWAKEKGAKKSHEAFEEWMKSKNKPAFTAENRKAYESWWKAGRGLPLSVETFSAFEEWLKSGKAMIGVHSSTDTLGDFKPYHSLINGTFDGHPWNAGELCTMTVHETSHVVAKPWTPEFQIKDEIYQYRNYDPKSVRVIYSLNMAKCKTKAPYHVPVCWVREFGKGRMFYTNLGHNEGTWTNPQFKEHLLTGIRWALKLEEGPAEPNPEIQYVEQIKAFVVVAGAGKDPDSLIAKAERAVKVDAAWGAKMYEDIDKYRRTDKKKDPEKAKAEVDRILGEIEKK